MAESACQRRTSSWIGSEGTCSTGISGSEGATPRWRAWRSRPDRCQRGGILPGAWLTSSPGHVSPVPRSEFIQFYGQGFTLTLFYGPVLRSSLLAGGQEEWTEGR